MTGTAQASAVSTGTEEARTSEITVHIETLLPDSTLLVPAGIATPYDEVTAVTVEGGDILRVVSAAGLAQNALHVRPRNAPLSIRYEAVPSQSGGYPEAAFRPRRTRYTDAADELAEAARAIACDAGGGQGAIEALVNEAQARFTYGHPEARFNDGLGQVPYLSCGVTEGSCVDINTYLVASLRAAGFEAAYLYGYFFPAERGGITNDMHCWVATRYDGETLEWDIAHHMKAGLNPVRPALNPKPGRRIALGHTMGHRYELPEGPLELKILAEPLWVRDGDALRVEPLVISIT